jgi:hypothetical protein
MGRDSRRKAKVRRQTYKQHTDAYKDLAVVSDLSPGRMENHEDLQQKNDI